LGVGGAGGIRTTGGNASGKGAGGGGGGALDRSANFNGGSGTAGIVKLTW
jgi:hypothetical protein